MNNKNRLKRIIDILMTIVLLFLMAYQVTGEQNHEWMGAGMLFMFILHNALNFRWYKALFHGSYSVVRVIWTTVNLATLAAIILTGFSGIAMSKHAFAFLNITGWTAHARVLHLAGSYWAFVLMSSHLGLHWSLVMESIRNKIGSNKMSAWIFRLSATSIAVYGAVRFYQADIYSYMLMRNSFAYLDYEKAAMLVLFENVSMMGTWIYISYYFIKGISKLPQNSEEKRGNTRFRSTVYVLASAFVFICSVWNVLSTQKDTSWGSINYESEQREEIQAPIKENAEENRPSSNPQDVDANILISYFTWADNTVVEDQDAALRSALSHYESMGDSRRYNEVDAIASSSVVAPGNAARIAGWIQQEIGGDLFSIQVGELYPSDYDTCLNRAADEKAEEARPELSTHVDNMEQYDTVFIGYPNWWYTCPMSIHSFIEEYDLSDKKIILFCTHGTGGLARSVRNITDSLPASCTIEENVLGLYRPEVPNAQKAVTDWLSEIGY